MSQCIGLKPRGFDFIWFPSVFLFFYSKLYTHKKKKWQMPLKRSFISLSMYETSSLHRTIMNKQIWGLDMLIRVMMKSTAGSFLSATSPRCWSAFPRIWLQSLCWRRDCRCGSVHQVLQLWIDEREKNGAGAVQNYSTVHQGPWFHQPWLWLEAKVAGVQGNSKKVSNQSHGLWR